MLTLPEKILFAIALLITFYVAYEVILRIIQTTKRGTGKVDWNLAKQRVLEVFAKVASLQPTFKLRVGTSIIHSFVAWGFLYYMFVNTGDVLEGFIPGFHFLGQGTLGDYYRLGADIFSILVLSGMIMLMIRRFIINPPILTAREDIFLKDKIRHSIRRDSAIVGAFIIIHVGSRFLSQTFKIAGEGGDPWQPFGSFVANLWSGASPTMVIIGEHIFFWLALGTIFLFIPYFLYSKHLHFFIVPFNYLFKPESNGIGLLDKLDFEDETIEQFGASRLEDLSWNQILDSYACIMCMRCQEECPAYNTGKILSPAALEINKRYFLNYESKEFASGEPSPNLVEFAIPEEAVWGCTTCGACIEICPLGNEPMKDILDIRRGLVLMDNKFPDEFQTAFRGMERTGNPWGVPSSERMKWAEGFNVPTVQENPDADILWWVGCAPATDARAQKTAQAFATILNAAGVNFAVLGENEQCSGDPARRAGNEYLFFELATANVEMLNEVNPKRIVTTCPHCLNTLKNEYPAFGGNYDVIHHSQLIEELLADSKLTLSQKSDKKITFHDPCYLGRHNNIYQEPRELVLNSGAELIEMEHHGNKSFCCGGGGAQMWKEEEEGTQRVSIARFKEAENCGADTLAVGCPFCLNMLADAGKELHSEMELLDIAEIIASQLSQS